MLRFKIRPNGIVGFFCVWLMPLILASMALFMLWGLISGIMYDADTSGKTYIEAMFVGVLCLAVYFLVAGLNQWLVINDDVIQQKITCPFDQVAWYCPWSAIVSARVWSDKIPEDPDAVIKRIVITRPFVNGKYSGYNLVLGKNITEIRQVMDFINAKIPDKVLWEFK